jgi:gas vesicle protein
MSRDDSVGGGTLVLAFIAGAVTGAAVALLFAPASGDDTRQFLGERARDSREKANEAARQGREFLNRQRDTIKSAIDRGRDAYQQARDGQGSEETV